MENRKRKCGAVGSVGRQGRPMKNESSIVGRCRILSSPLMKLSSPHDVAIVVSKVPSFSGGP